MCPTTERDLADGIGPTAAFRDAGVAMCLGSDSHAVIDLFEEARAVELDERLASGRARHPPAVRAARAPPPSHGHRSLGWPDAGRIAVGALADLVSVDLDSVRTAGVRRRRKRWPRWSSPPTAADVTDVVVGGEHVVRRRRHRTIDVAAELDASIRDVVGRGAA